MEALGKDLKGYLGQKLDERDFLNYCSVNKNMCNDESYKLYLFNRYPDKREEFIKDKDDLSSIRKKTWKQYFLMFVYYKTILNNTFSEDEQKNFLEFVKEEDGLYVYNTVSKMKNRLEKLVNFKGGPGFFVLFKSGNGDLEGVKFGISRIQDPSDDPFFELSIIAAEEEGFTEIVDYLEKFKR